MLPMITLGHSRLAHRGGDARRADHLGPAAGADAVQGETRVRLGTHRQHVHRQRHRRADGARLRAVVRRDLADPVRDPDAAHRRGLRDRSVRRAQQHDRHLVHADLRRDRLRLQEARLPAGAAGARPGAGRPRGERAAPEPDHVAGVAGDLLHAAHRRRHHAVAIFFFLLPRDHPVVAAAPGFTCARIDAAGRVNWRRLSMGFLIGPEYWARWLGIVIIDLSLAGDNALVIAMAVLTLPPGQRLVGMIGGTLGAVLLRIALIAVVTQLLLIPFLQAIGGLILIWIAAKLIRQDSGEGKEQKARQITTIWEAMGIIIVADLIMSLDNVLAVAATAHGDFTLVLFGIGLSIPVVICGSSLLARLMDRFRWIVWLGGGVLGWVAGELVADDAIVRGWIGSWELLFHWALPSLLATAMTIWGWALARRHSEQAALERVKFTC